MPKGMGYPKGKSAAKPYKAGMNKPKTKTAKARGGKK